MAFSRESLTRALQSVPFFLSPSLRYICSNSLFVARVFFHHVSLTTAPIAPRPLRFFLGTPCARGHSLFRSRSARVTRSRRPRAKHTSLNSLVSFPLISPTTATFSVSVRSSGVPGVHVHVHTHTPTHVHRYASLSRSSRLSSSPLPLFFHFSVGHSRSSHVVVTSLEPADRRSTNVIILCIAVIVVNLTLVVVVVVVFVTMTQLSDQCDT